MPLAEELQELGVDIDDCQAIRDQLDDLEIIGCGVGRRLEAVAFSRDILLAELEDCEKKSDEERDDEEHDRDRLRLPYPIEPPEPEREDCPIDLQTWLCLPPERIPGEVPECAPTPLGELPDDTNVEPFPAVPEPQDAEQLCHFIGDKLHDAMGHHVQLPINTLAAYTRILAALARRPNPPPGIIYKTCVETALDILTDYLGSGDAPPGAETLLPPIELSNRELDDYFTDIQQTFAEDVNDAHALADLIEQFSLTQREAIDLLPHLEDLLARAKAFGDEDTIDGIQAIIDDVKDLARHSTVDPNRVTPPGLVIPLEGIDFPPDYIKDQTTHYEEYLKGRALENKPLTFGEATFLQDQINGRADDFVDDLMEKGFHRAEARRLANRYKHDGQFGRLPPNVQRIIDEEPP